MGLLDALGLVSSAAPGAAPPAPAPPPPPAPEQAAFTAARALAQGLVDALKAHSEKALIQPHIAQAELKLASADVHAGKSEWPQAMKDVADAKTICVAAKKLADDRALYMAKRNIARAQIMSMEGIIDNAPFGVMITTLNNADAQATASPPNVPAAMATLGGLDAKIKSIVQSFVTSVQGMADNLAATDPKVQAFAAAEITQGKSLLANLKAAFAAGKWSEAVMSWRSATDVFAPAERMAKRRGAYETARAVTLAKLTAVKALPALKDQVAALQARLALADAAASHDAMKFEAGAAILTDLDTRCAAWTALAGDVDIHAKQRPLADAELAALDKHAAAASIATAREAARKLLKDASATIATASAASDPAPGWKSALTSVVRVRADLAAAKVLADGLGPAHAAQAAAAKPGDAAAMKTALKALQADAATALAAPFASEATAQFKAFKEQADKAEKALAKDDGKSAAKPMAQAAQSLTEAKAIQTAHAQYAATVTSVEAQLKKLQTLPRAAVLKGRIDAVAKALAEAKAKDKTHAGAEAMAGLRRASDAVVAAEKADLDRGKFDAAVGPTATRIAAVADPKAKKAFEAALADAKKLADAFRFDDADAARKRIEVNIDQAALSAAASANPNDPQIATLAAKMVANGGAKDVDDLIQNKKTADPRMIASLAKGRYGVDFVADGAAPGPREARNMKALCDTFSKVPVDVSAHGSITSITHTDSSLKGDVSGAYASDATVTLTGRPKTDTQGFGNNLTRKIAGGKSVKQLPAKIDPDCQAVGGAAELLSFTALHEVGHGVDDANSYMARNGHLPDHGGWTDYGSGVQPIADAVAASIAAKVGAGTTFYKKPEDRKYVLAKILNQPAVRPTVAPGSDDEKALVAFDRWYTLATSAGVYEREPDCAEITIGTLIYHEAYARNWVSYLASARSKGLTGYQFRAPGEWFAELYAGFRSNKLGPKHPAREWLKKL